MNLNKIRDCSEVKAVFMVASTYSLLLYYMVFGKDQFQKTFFFVSDAISDTVQNKMKYVEYLSFKKYSSHPRWIQVIIRFFLYKISYIRWPFLRTAPLYGGDHLWFAPSLIRSRDLLVFEDGLANYDRRELERTISFKHKWLYKFLYGPFMCEGEYGMSKQVKKIFLTGLDTIPDLVRDKSEIIDINKLWQSCDQEYIFNLFNLSIEDVELIKKKKVLLLSQPYNIDIGDQALVDIYNDILSGYSPDDIIIKTHPRDTLNFSHYFPGIDILTKKIPAELFAFIGLNFTDIYTINSTAIFSFPKKCNLHYLGYRVHPTLLEKYGDDIVKM